MVEWIGHLRIKKRAARATLMGSVAHHPKALLVDDTSYSPNAVQINKAAACPYSHLVPRTI